MIPKRKLDEYYMHRALSLARRGTGVTAPNPRVGCVVVKEGRIIGEGYHAFYGGDHAEAAALKDVKKKGENPQGATVYVNLEPCSHYGKTPPCAPRLVEAKVGRVVIGTIDPNPKVDGSGIQILRQRGIEVSYPCLENESRWINRGFFRAKTLGRPWVTLKAASGMDGRMALSNGESQWITGETSRMWAHLMRSEHDGILVGVGTVLKDDPELTVRHTCGKSPLRIILDTELSLLPTARILQSGGCLVFTCTEDSKKQRVLEKAGAEVCLLPRRQGRVDIGAAMAELVRRGIFMLMVEGGPRVLSSFIENGFCDSLSLFLSSRLMGQGLGMADYLNYSAVNGTVRLTTLNLRRSGEDVLWEGRFECSPVL